MDQQTVLAQFETLLPLAVDWAAEQEQRILREGVSLSEHQLGDARMIGVHEPARVRLLQVPVIPRPADPRLDAACDAIDFLTPETRGLTLQYGIFIRADWWGDRSLLLHELVHVTQYERFGGISPFLRQYLSECLTSGYSASPLEREAIELTSAALNGLSF